MRNMSALPATPINLAQPDLKPLSAKNKRMIKDRQGVCMGCGAFRHMRSQLWYLHKYIIHI